MTPLTSAQKMASLRKRRAALGIVCREYWGTLAQHKKTAAFMAKLKKSDQKKKKVKT